MTTGFIYKVTFSGMKKRISIVLSIILIFGGLASVAYAFRFKFFEWQKAQVAAKLPPPIDANIARLLNKELTSPNTSTPPSPVAPSATLPVSINLAVPFTSQAPYAVWDAFHNDACEEASVLMVTRFWQGKALAGPADVEAELQGMKAYEDQTFGYDQDTSAEQTAKILTDYYHIANVEVRYDITLEDIKREVLGGHPVIVPASGRDLHNPFYKQPGPVYHMLVIKGVTADGKFITNDPGTRRGADFVYGQAALYGAINDWDNVTHKLSGRKAMIVVVP